MEMVTFISGEEMVELLPPKKAVDAVREAFSLLYKGEVQNPPRTVLTVEGNWWGVMPCSTKYGVTVKVISVITGNKERGIPSVNGAVLLLSGETGNPLALMDGSTLTAIRTSAASVLSTELSWGLKVETLGVIGAGLEAEHHMRTALGYLSVSRLLLTSRRRHPELARKFGAEEVELKTLLRESDVIFAVTSSSSPVVLGTELKNDFHVSSIGAHTPKEREVDDETIRKVSTYMVDSLDAVSRETGDFILPKERGLLQEKTVMEIGEVIVKGVKVKRPSLFKTVGLAVEDNVTAYFVYREKGG